MLSWKPYIPPPYPVLFSVWVATGELDGDSFYELLPNLVPFVVVVVVVLGI